ncbi:preprotein translocase subunit YajC [Metabacillus sp. SLBN-84]
MTVMKIVQYLFSGMGIVILSFFYYQMFKPQKKEVEQKPK